MPIQLPDRMFAAPEIVDTPPPVDPRVAREEQIADTTRAEQGLNRFLAAKQNLLFEAPDAFYRQQGEDAIHAAPVTTQKLDELRRDLLDRLGNDAQRQRLSDALNAQMHLARDGMNRHVAEQSQVWQRQVAQDRIALLAKEAALHHNDDDVVDAIGHAAATAARAHSRVGDGPPAGEAEDTAAATARSGVLGAAIQARLDRGDTEGANALFTQVRDQLDPEHAAPLQGQIQQAQQTPPLLVHPEIVGRGTIEPDAATPERAVEADPIDEDPVPILSDASPEPLQPGQQYAAGGRPPSRRLGPGGRDLTPREEMRWDFFNLHRTELEKLEPNNPRLSYIAPTGWVPSQRNVDEMARETANARARAATANSSAKLSSSDRITANAGAGKKFEQEFNSKLEEAELRIGSQITLETPSGQRTRIDFITRHPSSGEIRCIECKASETAPLTRNQRIAFPELGSTGATVKGAGKPEFPGGTYIPPTNVEIVRKR